MTATNNPTNQVTFRTVLPHFPNIPANRAVTRTISTFRTPNPANTITTTAQVNAVRVDGVSFQNLPGVGSRSMPNPA